MYRFFCKFDRECNHSIIVLPVRDICTKYKSKSNRSGDDAKG
jgi:hypothetical protein